MNKKICDEKIFKISIFTITLIAIVFLFLMNYIFKKYPITIFIFMIALIIFTLGKGCYFIIKQIIKRRKKNVLNF